MFFAWDPRSTDPQVAKMVSVLESYEQQFANLTAEITVQTARIPTTTGAEKINLGKKVVRQLEEAHELLEQVELEIREIPAIDRQKYLNRLKSYKLETSRLEKDLKQAEITFHDDTDSREDFGEIQADQKTRLLDNTLKLERQGKKLNAGYRLIIESEEMGAAILNDLQSQRETLTRVKDRIRETNDDLGKSSRLLSRMARTLMQNKMVMYGAGLAVVIITVILIYVAATR